MFACDQLGSAWYRYGTTVEVTDSALPPAWVQLEIAPDRKKTIKNIFTRKTSKSFDHNNENHSEVKMGPLLKIAVGGIDDEMVWAVDSKHAAYCRIGVTTDFPIGTEWIRVSAVLSG